VAVSDRESDALPRVDVQFGSSDAPSYAAVVSLHGEHDLSTAPTIRDALSPLYGAILLDLSSCDFIDSTVIRTVLDKHRQLETDGHRLELLVPSDRKPISRVLDVSGLRQILTVHDTMPGSPGETRPASR
jgi:anti-sigma B factor antagonist